jgi:hypothetical protein
MTATDTWTAELTNQLDWHWQNQLRPRLSGLTDEEYFWEPVPGCWSIRARGSSTAPIQVGTGSFTMDYAFPEPDPPPVTTIAWRIAHIVVAVLASRIAGHFGGPPVDYRSWEFAGTAAEALDQLDAAYAAWTAGVRGLDDQALLAAVGPAEEGWEDSPMRTLVLHINRETIHHGAEVALLRDLYAHRR